MGRLFDSKETSKSTTTKGRLFTEPVAERTSTLGKVGEFVKPIVQDIYKTAATIPIRATQAGAAIVGEATNNPQLKKKAFEYASEPVNIGLGTQVKPLDTSSVGRATQQTAGDILKAASLTPIGKGLTLAKQVALQGGTYGLGNALSEGKSATDTVKETAIGTVGGLLLGKGLSILGGAKAANQLAKKTEAQLFEEAKTRANFGPIPEASSPRLSLPAPRTPSETPIQLPEKGVLEAQQRIREPYAPTAEVKPNSPLYEEASKFNVRDDFVNSQIKKETKIETSVPKSDQAKRATQKSLNEFIKSETDFLIKTQQKIPKGYKEKLTKIWETANKPAKVTAPSKSRSEELANIWNEAKGVSTPKPVNIPKSESTPKTTSLPFGRVPTPENTSKIIRYETNSYGKKTPIYEQTTPTNPTPQESVAIAKAKKEGASYITQANRSAPTPEVPTAPVQATTQEGFQSVSYADRTAKLNQMDSQHIEDVVFNGATPDAGLPKEAYISHLYNQAENNPALAERLATSGVVTEAESKAGQNLGALAQARGSVVGIIKDAHEALKKALPGYVKTGEKKELETIQNDIKTAFSKFNDKALSVEERLSAIDILKCK